MSTQYNLEFDHAPLASLDYGFNWTLWLSAGETIISQGWVCNSNTIALSLEQLLANVTSVYATGGVLGVVYQLTNTITTSAGRTDSRTIVLSCKKR